MESAMMATRLTFPAAVLAVLGLAAVAAIPVPARAAGERITGSGVSKTETRPVNGFRALALAVQGKLELRQDGTEGLVITGDDNIVPLVETVVENGTLQIRWKKGVESVRYQDLRLVVHATNVEGLAIAGSGEIGAKALKTGNLQLHLAGSGRMTIDALKADSVRLSIDGSGEVTLAGRVESLDGSAAGSGRLSAANLESRNAFVAVAGSGAATIGATEMLAAKVVGSGEIRYYGNPRVTSTVAGSGIVKRAGDRPG
jgi:Putative auto-transporter adhesin, head GIN domain